jgi:Methyltransferase domain
VGVPRVYFDERIAERYEAYWPNLFEPAAIDPVVSFLADLADEGGALEFGVGTGRIALPLSQRGVRVHGIDLSPAMVARLQAEPGADGVGVTVGDFATTTVGATFRLVYLLRNTIMNLTTQDEGQLEIFSSPFRFVWPSELDLMARMAGMSLRERWSGWKREPFTSESTMHVSVWEKGT